LIGDHCASCGRPLIFVVEAERWDLNTLVVCPGCIDLESKFTYLSVVDRNTIATELLLVASELRRLVHPEEPVEEGEFVKRCTESAMRLRRMSNLLVPPKEDR
jgi:hypothetical protein